MRGKTLTLTLSHRMGEAILTDTSYYTRAECGDRGRMSYRQTRQFL